MYKKKKGEDTTWDCACGLRWVCWESACPPHLRTTRAIKQCTACEKAFCYICLPGVELTRHEKACRASMEVDAGPVHVAPVHLPEVGVAQEVEEVDEDAAMENANAESDDDDFFDTDDEESDEERESDGERENEPPASKRRRVR